MSSNDFIDFDTARLDTNSKLWQVTSIDGEPVLRLTGNIATTEKVGTDAYLEEEHLGKVALIGEPLRNYRMEAEMRFLGHHHSRPNAGWFGFAIRAQDFLNYEIVWFMPNAEPGSTVAYVPAAHGIVPWWTEAYAQQKKGGVSIPSDDWFKAGVNVAGDEFSIYVNGQFVFSRKITYYLEKGRPGFFVGTATDTAFRRLIIKPVD